MNIEEKYHHYWCLNLDSALTDEQLDDLKCFLKANPHKQQEWGALEEQTKGLNKVDFTLSDNFELNVIKQMKNQSEQMFDRVSMRILTASIAAAVLLMINLFVNQGAMSIDAMFGIADMNADNTGLLFYID